MPKFNYVAMDSRGKETKGTLEVGSQADAINRLKEILEFGGKGLVVVVIGVAIVHYIRLKDTGLGEIVDVASLDDGWLDLALHDDRSHPGAQALQDELLISRVVAEAEERGHVGA